MCVCVCVFIYIYRQFINGFSKEPFVVYRILSVLIRTIIKVMSMFISKLKLFTI